MTTYERYCSIRDASGLKDSDVALKSGVNKSTFTDWKTGRSEPKMPKLVKIAAALGTTAEFLLNGDEKLETEKYSNEIIGIAMSIYHNPKLKELFDCANNSDDNGILMGISTIRTYEQLNRNNNTGRSKKVLSAEELPKLGEDKKFHHRNEDNITETEGSTPPPRN